MDIEELKGTDRFQEIYVETLKTTADEAQAEVEALRRLQAEQDAGDSSPSAKRLKADERSPKSASNEEMRKKRLLAIEEQQRRLSASQQAVSRTAFKKREWEFEPSSRDRPPDMPQVHDPEAVAEPTIKAPESSTAEKVPAGEDVRDATASATASTRPGIDDAEIQPRRDPTISTLPTGAGRKTTIVFFDESEAQGDARLADMSPTERRQAETQGDGEPAEPSLFPEEFEANALDNLAAGLREDRTDPLVAAAALEQAAKRIRALQAEVSAKDQVADHYGRVLNMVQMCLNSAGMNREMSADQRESAFAAATEDRPKNFMVKKGDAPVSPKEKEQAAKAREVVRTPIDQAPRTLSNSMSRDEMEQQRKDRLARLEKQQESAKKERVDMDRKTKAREAMFERPFATGAGRTLGNK